MKQVYKIIKYFVDYSLLSGTAWCSRVDPLPLVEAHLPQGPSASVKPKQPVGDVGACSKVRIMAATHEGLAASRDSRVTYPRGDRLMRPQGGRVNSWEL